ncbi:GNAT family N-acetyltransferase [Novosphingobium album (ex Liu et al. 2023)]|uniref:GNAT family N-acetyltransferase n=1 Tax=Novosphingobium album (ex Liu et al. 2023) TaxID=3031130 RepID=A0ABT5WMM8_9SPHN|nr:GNAT family N-acetyltransferase [Novosphingobium album (ex Liu et al. 2023)]MDE8651304.1 GNAT family N-acetyltransferase [Novosphingobium album (ex Liu et al. 2023)]
MPPPIASAAGFGISYRALADADLPFIAELYASTRREEVARTGWPEAMREAFLRQQHEAQHRHYTQHYTDAEWLVIEARGEPIGRLYLLPGASNLHIVDISLLPVHRGAGLGGAILADVIAMAGAAGQTVSIHVEKTNPARRLYARLGFAMIADRGVHDLMRTAAPASPDLTAS